MRILTLLFVTIAVLALALPAQAEIITDALEMTLTYDAAGNATLMNNTGTALNVDGLDIRSAGGNCDPVGWVSITDSALADAVGTMTALGVGALSFGELVATTAQLSEANLSNSALFGPGAPWSIGKPLMAGTQTSDLLFYYTKPESEFEGNMFLGVIVPEPATMVLLGLGLVAIVSKRKRN